MTITVEVTTNAGETFRLGRIINYGLNHDKAWFVQQDMDTRIPFTTRYSGIKGIRPTRYKLSLVP